MSFVLKIKIITMYVISLIKNEFNLCICLIKIRFHGMPRIRSIPIDDSAQGLFEKCIGIGRFPRHGEFTWIEYTIAKEKARPPGDQSTMYSTVRMYKGVRSRATRDPVYTSSLYPTRKLHVLLSRNSRGRGNILLAKDVFAQLLYTERCNTV